MEIVGIDEEKIKQISVFKKEDDWVTQFRLDSFQKFKALKMPNFGPETKIDFNKIIYYKNNDNIIHKDWMEVNKEIKEEMDSLGVIESEKHLDGIGVQYESEVIYHNMLKEIAEKKVIFTSIEDAMKRFPQLIKK